MAVYSSMLPLGTVAPDFSLPDVTAGKTIALADYRDRKALLVIFLCAHCPYVVHVQAELARLARDYADQSLGIVGITSNDIISFPMDSPQATAEMARAAGLSFPILYDESQQVAKSFTAACTPDFFLFSPDRKLAYRGQLDESRPSRGTPDGKDLRAAIDAVLSGGSVNPAQSPSIGCNVKWKPSGSGV